MNRNVAPERLAWWAIAALGLLWLVTVQGDLGDLTGDSAKYVALARSLLDGHGYRAIYLPGSPPFREAPFLFPCLLLPVVAVAGLNAWWLHVWMVGLSTVALGWLWCGLQRRTDGVTAFLALVLTGASPLWWDGVSRIMSDVPFVGLVALACWCVARYRSTPTVTRSLWCSTLLALVAACYLRTVGVVVGIAAALVLCGDGWRDRRSSSWWRMTLALLAVWTVACGAWAWHLCGGGLAGWSQLRLADPLGPYAAPLTLGGVWLRVLLHLRYYAAEAALVLCPVQERVSPWPEVTAWCVLGVAAVGWVRQWRAHRGVEWLFMLLYCGALLSWSYHDSRLLLPLVPWLWLAFLSGLQVLTRSGVPSAPRRSYVVAVAVLALLQSVALGAQVRRALRGTTLGRHQQEFIDANRWFASRTPLSSIVLSSKPSVTWWYSRRVAVDYPPLSPTDGPETVRRRLLACGAEYLLLDAFSPAVHQAVVPALARDLRGWRTVAIFGETSILQRRHPPSEAGP